MTKVELLKKCIRDYPPGTKYYGMVSTGIVSGAVFEIREDTTFDVKQGLNFIMTSHVTCVCAKGVWAPVISKGGSTDLDYIMSDLDDKIRKMEQRLSKT